MTVVPLVLKENSDPNGYVFSAKHVSTFVLQKTVAADAGAAQAPRTMAQASSATNVLGERNSRMAHLYHSPNALSIIVDY
jgi:hypothetical protein